MGVMIQGRAGRYQGAPHVLSSASRTTLLFQLASAYLSLMWLGGIALMSGAWINAGIATLFISVHVGGKIMSGEPAR